MDIDEYGNRKLNEIEEKENMWPAHIYLLSSPASFLFLSLSLSLSLYIYIYIYIYHTLTDSQTHAHTHTWLFICKQTEVEGNWRKW